MNSLLEKQQRDYLKELEVLVSPATVERFKYWPIETKLYMYLHHIQIETMNKYMELLSKHVSKS